MSTQNGKEPGQDPDKLVDDEAFVGLMEDAWKKEGAPVDQISKNRIWNQLEKQLPAEKKPGRGKWQLPALLVAGLAGIIIASKSFWAPVGDDTGQQIKGQPGMVGVRVGYYLQEKEGELLPWNPSQRKAGQVIVPYVEVKPTAAVTLLRKTGDDAYEMVSDAQWAKTGFEHYFSAGDESVAIQLEAEAETYCVLAVSDMPAMGQIIPALPALEVEGRNATVECFSL